MSKNSQIEMVPLKKIKPDPDQPRKNFVPERMAELIASIKKHGIMNPLIVEELPDGYLLEDGERRFRAAKELGLEEVPVIVSALKQPMERLVRQFHLQEQHEGWSPVEKASAVSKLAIAMKINVRDMGKLLSLPERTLRDYIAFGELLERKEFEKTELSLHFARAIYSVRIFVTKFFEKKELEFGKDMQRGLELAIISRLKNGDIKKTSDIAKIKDAAKINPAMILKFIESKGMTVQKLFLDAEAKVAWHYRNARYGANQIAYNVKEGMKLKMDNLVEGDKDAIRAFTNARDALDTLLAKV